MSSASIPKPTIESSEPRKIIPPGHPVREKRRLLGKMLPELGIPILAADQLLTPRADESTMEMLHSRILAFFNDGIEEASLRF